MNINWDLVLCLYGFSAAISFIVYLILLHKKEDVDVSISTLQLLFMLLIVIAFWWLHIGMICYKLLYKPIIKKRKAT